MRNDNTKKNQEQYSPILFTTTLRSPERCKYLLKIIQKYNGQVLDDNLAIQIMKDCVKEKIYFSLKAFKLISNYKDTYNSDIEISDQMAEDIVTKVSQDHKQRGFDKGWSSRFKTVFELARLFGFVWFNEPEFKKEEIKVTNLGNKLAECCELDNLPEPWKLEPISEREQSIFLHALTKYQVNNPFKRVLNKVNPLSLLLKTIKLLNEDNEISSTGISKKELAILVFWRDNNSEELYKTIKELRKSHGFNPSDETILEICDSLTGGKRQKSRQDRSILNEYPDDFNRKMVITGLISRRGEGRFFDINKKRADLAEYIIQNYSIVKKHNSEKEYFNYVSSEDTFLLDYKTQLPETINSDELDNWSLKLGWETIKKELLLLSNKKSSKHEIIKDIVAYIRLEWLIALSIKINYSEINIKPNLKSDDEGIPYHQAPPKKFDIEIENDKDYIFIEATLINNAEQVPREINKIPRKINEYTFINSSKGKKTFFIAPNIHEDSKNMIEWLLDKKNIKIINYNIEDFIKKIELNREFN